MIIRKKYMIDNISKKFISEILEEKELSQIVGGKRRRGKSRDKDHLDLDDIEIQRKRTR